MAATPPILRAGIAHVTPAAGPGASHTWAARTTAPAAGRPPDFEPGQRLGAYTLVRPLGRGGQAVVWHAEDARAPGRPVSLKVFAPAWTPEALAPVIRLRRAAAPGGPLGGTAVLPLLRWGRARGLTYFVAPLVRGMPLSAALDQRRAALAGDPPAGGQPLARLPTAAYLRGVVGHLARIAEALAAVHAAGLAHGDIKPANILLGRRGPAYLIDFASARPLRRDGHGPEAGLTGTPAYMAAEKLRGDGDVDEVRCDIYALGVTLYEATTLRLPHVLPRGEPASAWAAALAESVPPRLRAACPGIATELEELVGRALAYDPARRPGTAREVATALRAAARAGVVADP